MEHPGALPSSFVELLGALPDAVVVATTEGRIVAVNANLCALSGYSSEELLDVPVETLVPTRVRAEHVALRSGYIAAGGGVRSLSARLDLVLARSDGTEVPVDIALCTIPHADHHRLVVATVRDASTRRHAELCVERERAYLSAMNEVSSALLDAGELEDILRLVTKRARTLLDADLAMLILPVPDEEDTLVVRVVDGLAARELLGSTLPADHSMAGLAMRAREPALIADGSTDPRLFRPPAWPDDIGATLIVPLHARGEPVGSMTIAKRCGRPMFLASDVTFIKTLAEKATLAIAFAKTQELVERTRVLRIAATRSAEDLGRQREMLDRMEELGRTKSDVVSKISHELRSPLTSVIGYVELLIDGGPGDPTEEQGRMLEIIERNSRRLLALIEDLLTMSRVEAGIFELEVGPVDLGEVVEHVRETIAPTVAQAELELVVDLGTDLRLIGDREQLERALLNLVSNSVKFTSPRGQVEIATRRDRHEILVSVRDTGSGVPSEEQEHLFTRFFRATRSQDQEVPGTGLGLYIVKQIVELHGGAMEAASTDHGSTFTMRLPIRGPPTA